MLLAPHAGSVQTAVAQRTAEEFTTPLPIAYQGTRGGSRAPSASFLSVDVPNVVVGRRWAGQFKPYEIKTLRMDVRSGAIREVNLLEE